MYRLLHIFLPAAWRRIQVRRVKHSEHLWVLPNNQHKYTTRCCDNEVEVRHGKFAGWTWGYPKRRAAYESHSGAKTHGVLTICAPSSMLLRNRW